MKTNEQRRNLLRLHRYIEREQLVSCMNNTKWQAAIDALSAIQGYQPQFRVRMVTDFEDLSDDWDMSFPYHIPTFICIEWLELDPIKSIPRGQLVTDEKYDFTEAMTNALKNVNVPFSMESSVIRIWGYLRPGVNPLFR